MFYFVFIFSFMLVVVSHLLMYSIKHTMKQSLQGNTFKIFPQIRLNVSDFSVFFYFLFRRQKTIFLKAISCILLCQNPLK